MQREHVAGLGERLRALEETLRDGDLGNSVDADQFVERRQRGRKLRAPDQLGAPDRQMRVRAAAIRAIIETQLLRQAQRMNVHLPPGGAMRLRWLSKYVDVPIARALHFAPRP